MPGLTLYFTPEFRQRLGEAAKRDRRSMTQFLLIAAEERMRKLLDEAPDEESAKRGARAAKKSS